MIDDIQETPEYHGPPMKKALIWAAVFGFTFGSMFWLYGIMASLPSPEDPMTLSRAAFEPFKDGEWVSYRVLWATPNITWGYINVYAPTGDEVSILPPPIDTNVTKDDVLRTYWTWESRGGLIITESGRPIYATPWPIIEPNPEPTQTQNRPGQPMGGTRAQ